MICVVLAPALAAVEVVARCPEPRCAAAATAIAAAVAASEGGEADTELGVEVGASELATARPAGAGAGAAPPGCTSVLGLAAPLRTPAGVEASDSEASPAWSDALILVNSLAILRMLRRMVEYQWFLMALSVLRTGKTR